MTPNQNAIAGSSRLAFRHSIRSFADGIGEEVSRSEIRRAVSVDLRIGPFAASGAIRKASEEQAAP